MKKIALSLFLLGLFFTLSYGQRRISLPFSSNYDEESAILVGIQYSYVNQNYQLKLKSDWQTTAFDFGEDNINSLLLVDGIGTKNSHGFSVGIPVDFRLNDNLYITFSPSFLFINNSGINYQGYTLEGETTTLVRRSRHNSSSPNGANFNSFEFPLSLKIRSDEKTFKKFNRYRGYLIGGVKYARFAGINNEYEQLLKERTNGTIAQSIILKPEYISWEFGFGADIFFPHFRMSPEIKFNQSFRSVLDQDHALSAGNQFMAPLEKGLIRNIYVGLIFQ